MTWHPDFLWWARHTLRETWERSLPRELGVLYHTRWQKPMTLPQVVTNNSFGRGETVHGLNRCVELGWIEKYHATYQELCKYSLPSPQQKTYTMYRRTDLGDQVHDTLMCPDTETLAEQFPELTAGLAKEYEKNPYVSHSAKLIDS